MPIDQHCRAASSENQSPDFVAVIGTLNCLRVGTGRLKWRDAGMHYLGACFDAEDLRQTLAFLERRLQLASNPTAQQLDVMMALTIVPMIEACRARHLRKRPLPVELAGIDLSPEGALWKRCMAVLEPYRTSWAWLALERGTKAGKIPVLTTSVAILAARGYDERESESLEATGGRWGQIQAMLRGDWLREKR